MVLITLKTIFDEKVGHNFCQVILSFWLRQNVVPYTKYKTMNIFIRSSRDHGKMANDPQVENH